MDKAYQYNQPIVLSAVSVLFFILEFFSLLDWLHDGFNRATVNLRAGIVEKRSGLVSPVSEDLEAETALASCRLEVEKLKEENASARRLLGVKLPTKAKYEPAKVLGASKEFLTLNIGVKSGIEKEAAVLADGVLLGQIIDLSDTQSKVQPLTNSKTLILVGIWPESGFEGESNPPVKAILRGGSSLVLEEILAGEKISEGDLVASLDFGGIYLIGKVERVWLANDGLFKKALVNWFVNPEKLVTVFVAK